MQRLSHADFSALVTVSGFALISLVLTNPLLAFVMIFGAWSGLRWPSERVTNPHMNVGPHVKIGSAASVSDAFYEALWAAVLLVGGIILIFELMTGVGAV